MIKKILLMSASIVLGCMITAASFAWPPSSDCVDARAVHRDVLEAVQLCRDLDIGLDCSNFLVVLRASKRACMRVVRQVCPHGTYANNANPADVEVCDRVVVERDVNSYIIGKEIYHEDGNYAIVSMKRDEDGNIISLIVDIYDADDILVATYTYP